MKAESNVRPNKFEIENIVNNKCEIVLNTNIVEIQDEEGTKYTYDTYRLKTSYRDNLHEKLENEEHYRKWLEFAVELEYNELASDIRAKRDDLLAETDWTQVTDSALSEEKKEQYRIYRQALRDITKQEHFPYEVVFPEMPQ